MFTDINDLLDAEEQEKLRDPDADVDENDIDEHDSNADVDENGSIKAISDEEGLEEDEEELELDVEEDEPPRRNRKVADGTPVRVRKRVIGSSPCFTTTVSGSTD